MADTPKTSLVPSNIQKILDHSQELCDRSVLLREQSKLAADHFEQLFETSLLLCEEGKRLCKWKQLRRDTE